MRKYLLLSVLLFVGRAQAASFDEIADIESLYHCASVAKAATVKSREPYKIHSPDENGNYKTTDEPKSVEQKKKYS